MLQIGMSGRTHVGLITNSHVVAPPESARETDRKEYDTWGLDYNARSDNVSRTAIHYFAVKDVNATMSDIEEPINLAGKGLLEYTREDTRRIGEQNLAKYNRERSLVERMPLHLGKTIINIDLIYDHGEQEASAT